MRDAVVAETARKVSNWSKRLERLAESCKLDDPIVIEKQVLRMLADKRSQQFVENFTTQWLSLGKMKSVNINQDLFPH